MLDGDWSSDVCSSDLEDALVREALALNPKVPPATLTKLSMDDSITVQTALARNPSIPSETLLKLAASDCNAVRNALLQRKDLPVDALSKLTAAEEVKFALATRAQTHESVLETLAADPDPSLRTQIANHPVTNKNTLGKMVQDASQYVRAACAANPNAGALLNNLAKDKEALVRARVAANPSATGETLTLLAKDESPEVRRAVAGNRNTPKDVLSQLAADSTAWLTR
jgi:hypothetical protein